MQHVNKFGHKNTNKELLCVAYSSAFLTYVSWLNMYYPFVNVFNIAFYKTFISTKAGAHSILQNVY
jgi:hypothetical protein